MSILKYLIGFISLIYNLNAGKHIRDLEGRQYGDRSAWFIRHVQSTAEVYESVLSQAIDFSTRAAIRVLHSEGR